MKKTTTCGRSFAGLLRPLDDDQGAPVGFLVLERLVVRLLGPTELALRLVPFLASIATLVLVYRFCRAHLDRPKAGAIPTRHEPRLCIESCQLAKSPCWVY